MAALTYVGAVAASAADLTYQAYLNALLAQNIPQSSVDSLIATGLAPYVTKSYVDTQDQLNATKAFIDAGDATKLKLAQRETTNGIAGLGASARVASSHVNASSTQRWPKPFISPAAYNSSTVSATGTEVQLYPAVIVADPGFPYKLLVTGLVDATTSVDGEFPVIRVRQGSATGPLVATGAGCAEVYSGAVTTPFTTAGAYTYPIPSWAATLDIVLLSGGVGGQTGNIISAGGKGGVYATTTVTRGTTITDSQIAGSVGAGGALNLGSGGPTTATAAGMTTLTAPGGSGGAPGNSAQGQSPGNKVYNGLTYVGGAATADAEGSDPGNPPGGGGQGGVIFGGFGGPGAPGAAWITAYPSPNVPYGPVTIVPSAYNTQASITGATSLYVMLARSGSASTVTATTLRPALYIVPVPA